MLVDGDSKLSRALKLHPDVLEVVVALNPHDFVRLRNPFMRKLMAPRITLKSVKEMINTTKITSSTLKFKIPLPFSGWLSGPCERPHPA